MHKTLFAGRDLSLDARDGNHPLSIVTFDSRNRFLPTLKPGPFGAGFGKGRFPSMNEYIIRISRNHWYQTQEILEVIGLINQRARDTRVVTYGSSMGAYAAINFAPMLNAWKFIALSPTFDIQPGNAAGDARWESDSKVLAWPYNFIRTGACREARGYAFFAGTQDKKHADLIAGETRATAIKVEHGGHPCSHYLNDTYGLKALVGEIANDSFDVDRFYAVLKDRTPKTHYPYVKSAADLEKAGKVKKAADQIRIALGIKDTPALHRRLGDLLLKAGDLTGAEDAFRIAIAAEPQEPGHPIRLSYVLAARKDYAGAAHLVRQAISIRKNRPEFHVRLGEWLICGGDMAGAEKAMQDALALAPDAPIPQARIKAIRAKRSGG